MDEIHVIILTIGLFVLTFINPGANLLVVVQTSLSSGKNAGLLTGLGVALGMRFTQDWGYLVWQR